MSPFPILQQLHPSLNALTSHPPSSIKPPNPSPSSPLIHQNRVLRVELQQIQNHGGFPQRQFIKQMVSRRIHCSRHRRQQGNRILHHRRAGRTGSRSPHLLQKRSGAQQVPAGLGEEGLQGHRHRLRRVVAVRPGEADAGCQGRLRRKAKHTREQCGNRVPEAGDGVHAGRLQVHHVDQRRISFPCLPVGSPSAEGFRERQHRLQLIHRRHHRSRIPLPLRHLQRWAESACEELSLRVGEGQHSREQRRPRRRGDTADEASIRQQRVRGKGGITRATEAAGGAGGRGSGGGVPLLAGGGVRHRTSHCDRWRTQCERLLLSSAMRYDYYTYVVYLGICWNGHLAICLSMLIIFS